MFSDRASAAFLRLMNLVPLGIVRRAAESLTEAVRRYSRHHAALARVLVMSIAVQAIRVIQAWCLGEARTLRADLESGAWAEQHADLLEREELDLGYRLLVA